MNRLVLRTESHQRVRAGDGQVRPERFRAFSYAEVPGLCVVEWPPLEGDPYPRYTITHVSSGARVGPHTYADLQDAEDALSRVAGLFDWTLYGATLRETFNARTRTDRAFGERMAAALHPIQRAEEHPHAA